MKREKYLRVEVCTEVFIYNAITGGEESKDMLDEVALVVGKTRE